MEFKQSMLPNDGRKKSGASDGEYAGKEDFGQELKLCQSGPVAEPPGFEEPVWQQCGPVAEPPGLEEPVWQQSGPVAEPPGLEDPSVAVLTSGVVALPPSLDDMGFKERLVRLRAASELGAPDRSKGMDF